MRAERSRMATPPLVWLVAMLLLLPLVAGCADGCENRIVQRIAAPDGKHVAVLFERSCGATTSFSTQISIIDRGMQESGSGNIFLADGNHGAAADTDWGGPWAEMEWLSARHLAVRFDDKARVFTANERHGELEVSFEKIRRPGE